MENRTDVKFIQELLRHNDIKTTLRYTRVSEKSIKKIKSPLDNMEWPDAHFVLLTLNITQKVSAHFVLFWDSNNKKSKVNKSYDPDLQQLWNQA